MAFHLLRAILYEQVPLVLTPAIALEYQDVLLRPGILALTKLTHEQSVDLVTLLIALARRVHLSFQWRPNLQDESDNKFVEAAIHGAATIVPYDLMHYGAPDLTPYGWAVMTPREFLLRHLPEELS
jgi:predicted nucleic acid-binding protein